MQQRSGPLPADDDSDSISVTSEGDQDYDADTEFVVEDVHCERVDPRDGVLKYLVEWANFPLDECTWEPGESLPQELRDQWESKKAKQEPSVAAAFEKKYNEAFNEKLEERRLKHRRRNAKRRRKGMRETNFWFRGHYYPDSDDGLDVEVTDEANNEAHNEPDTSSDEGAEEAKEDNSIDHGAKDSFLPLKSSSQTKPQKSVTQPNRIFKTNPNIASEPQAKTGSRIDETRVSATRPGNALDGATTTASNFAHKNITAKKSGQAPISAVNIFTGGRKRQQRQNLGSTMIDANKAPKLFTKARIRRKAELRSRDNDDRAPDPSQVLLFNISQPPPPRPTSRPSYDDGDSLFMSNADEPRVQTDAMMPASVRRDSTTANEPKSVLSKRRSSGLDGDRARKKAKSVRFTGEEDQPFVSEPMEISEPLGPASRMRSPPPPPRSPSPPAVPKAMLSLADYHSRTVQSVSKTVILAPKDQSLDVTFNGIPKDASREPDQQWLPKFLGSEFLRVGHTILAESVGRFGLLIAHEDYNFVIYPTKCDDFQMQLLGVEPSKTDEVALKYFAFGLSHNIPRLIRSNSATIEDSTDAKQSIKLVTAYNIVGFLRDLTDEKYALQAKLKQTKWKTMSSLDVAVEKKAAGLTDEDLDARAKAWLLAENWLSVSMERNSILSDDNHVIFADRSIDPNDEQSLVNWFGWWSLAKAEEYRKFFVLGTGTMIKDTNRSQPSLLSRARRTILIPRYERYVVNDPNEALRIAMRNAGELAGEEAIAPPAMPSGIKPKRHPWLAFYRPAEPHNRFGGYRHGKTELIIWDVRAGDVLEDDFALGLQDLTWMQRELVSFVQAHGAEKNPGSQLENVWLGGFKGHQAECSATLAADMTAEWMESTLANLKYKLPSTEGYMKQNGWRKVSLLKPLGPNRRLKNRQSIGQDGAVEQAANDEDTRIIFHPPRGSGIIGPRGSSRCKNDLYEAARLARLRDSNAREMDFTFRPTMEWYDEMIAEGRQYEHIYVDEWEKVFAQLGVFKSQHPKPSKASTASGQNGHTRTGSVNSSHSSSMDVNPV
ncbi:hypothetical protein VPNG_01248 [Cytospora leucostoma]|uniref:Chromo domain-containing protein n=1 Tax=Cytospora leucostoma TaxID=1230097 RepID=A0A423XLJ0_9PEZI|nr:hypothetical protein VPNG_01248 [Cytospora leucostoma]